GLRDAGAEAGPGVLRQLGDLRQVRRPLGGAWRRQLLSRTAARLPCEHRVHSRESLARRLHRISDAGGRERQHLSRESRTELLTNNGVQEVQKVQEVQMVHKFRDLERKTEA